jgi:hypothetical protein
MMTTYSLAEAPGFYNPLPAPLIVTYEEAAELLGGRRPLSTRHIERLVLSRDLKKVGKGKARRIVYSSVVDYIERASNGKA